jgi:hypothetical protein
MTIRDAVHAAIAGGWDFNKGIIGGVLISQVAFLDPLFWESLGKTLGWEHLNATTLSQNGRLSWHQMWVIFIDYLAQGETAEGFFQRF